MYRQFSRGVLAAVMFAALAKADVPALQAVSEPNDQEPRPAYKLPVSAQRYEFSPDGASLFHLDSRTEIHATSLKDAKQRLAIKDPQGIESFTFRAPNRILTGGTRIKIWELDKPKTPPGEIDPAVHDGPRSVQLLAVPRNALKEKAPHRDVFAISDRFLLNGGDFLVFDLDREDGVTGGRSRFGMGAIALSPDGERFAKGGFDWKVVTYRTGANAPTWTAEHDRDVIGLAFSLDGAMLAACGRKSVSVYDAKTGALISRRNDSGGDSIAFLDASGWYAATSHNQMIVQHARMDGKLTVNAFGNLAVSLDGKLVAARLGKAEVGIWRTEDLIAAAAATAEKK